MVYLFGVCVCVRLFRFVDLFTLGCLCFGSCLFIVVYYLLAIACCQIAVYCGFCCFVIVCVCIAVFFILGWCL